MCSVGLYWKLFFIAACTAYFLNVHNSIHRDYIPLTTVPSPFIFTVEINKKPQLIWNIQKQFKRKGAKNRHKIKFARSKKKQISGCLYKSMFNWPLAGKDD